MSAFAFGLGVLVLVSLPFALYVMVEDVLDFVLEDVVPFFKN